MPITRKLARLASSFGLRNWFLVLLLLGGTVIAYLPVLHAGFIWDDDDYVTKNATLLDLPGLKSIWCDPATTPQYYPLVFTTFWLEQHLWRLAPMGYHITNVLLHALGAILLWRILVKLEVPGSWLAAALFAWHPMGVESVAWITERKNVLSAVCYFASALAYLHFRAPSREEAGNQGRTSWYWMSLAFFVAALLSKTVTATLPAALLLVYWWKRNLRPWDVFLLLPFFVTGIGLGLHTAWLEKHQVGALGTEWSLTFADRILVAGRALWFYAGKLAWPASLIFIYPRWQVSAADWRQWLYPAAALAVILTLWWRRKLWGHGPLIAVLYFAGTLFPALGFVDVFPMRFSFVADHFEYLAGIGLLVLTATWLARAVPLKILWCLPVTFMVLTWRQTHVYHDQTTLWRDTAAKNPGCWLATYNLSTISAQEGRLDEAIAELKQAVASKPDFALAHYNLAVILEHNGRLDEALDHFQKANDYDPNEASAHLEYAKALVKKGQIDDAIIHFNRALELDATRAETHYALGIALLFYKNDPDGAISQLQAAIHAKPEYAEANNYLGTALLQKGRLRDAIANFQMAIRLRPHYALAENNLAWLLATSPDADIRNGPAAVELAGDANQASGGHDPTILMTLAAAYAEVGRYPEAAAVAQQGITLANSRKNAVLAETLQSQLTNYQSGVPLRVSGQTNAMLPALQH